jgi:hypothetical protein
LASPSSLGIDEVDFAARAGTRPRGIDKRSATWTTNNNAKIYFDSDPSPLTGGSGSNFVAGDGISAAYTRAAGESVGTYHITANLSSSVAGALNNYNITNTGATFTISNMTPSNLVVSGGTINENGSATVSGTFVDPDPMQPHTVTITWNDAGASSILNLAAGTFAFSAGQDAGVTSPLRAPRAATMLSHSLSLSNKSPAATIRLLGCADLAPERHACRGLFSGQQKRCRVRGVWRRLCRPIGQNSLDFRGDLGYKNQRFTLGVHFVPWENRAIPSVRS